MSAHQDKVDERKETERQIDAVQRRMVVIRPQHNEYERLRIDLDALQTRLRELSTS